MRENEGSRAARWARVAGRLNMDKGALKRRIAELEAENASLATDLRAAREALVEADAKVARLTMENEQLRTDYDFSDRAMLETAEDAVWALMEYSENLEGQRETCLRTSAKLAMVLAREGVRQDIEIEHLRHELGDARKALVDSVRENERLLYVANMMTHIANDAVGALVEPEDEQRQVMESLLVRLGRVRRIVNRELTR